MTSSATGSAGGPDAPAISVSGLRKGYAGRAVVDGLDFSVRTGDVFAILGPNGAGKTTTVEILEGYRRRDGGEVRVLGLDPATAGAELRGRVGLMLQGGGIYPQARPRELLRLYARFYRNPRDPDALLEQAGLAKSAGTRYKVLSGGQKQRLGLALALLGRPEVAILDEPTAGMDPAAKASTRDLIAGLRAEGTTVLLTTHELADVERLADQIAIIDRGRIVAAGTPAELAAGAVPRLRVRFAQALEPADLARLASALGGGPISADGGAGGYRVEEPASSPALVAALSSWCAERGLLIAELRTTGATLEERYLALTGDRTPDA
ncbi:MAG TPA: ABC transporter ATP-binding protein [Candidatus Limnocylindrales bacterium]|nr:ABC transporter ATP-binding protein [Candidatus Limnocylindrales bacterium]